jgi:hypothetical protein
VIASATGGPVPVEDGVVDVPLNPPLTVTPVGGQPTTLNIEVRGKLTRSGAEQCAVFFLPQVNGTPMLIGESLVLVAADESENPLTAKGIPRASASFPLGLTSPGEPLTIGLQFFSDAADCTPSSTIDQVAVVATRLK